MFTRECVQSLSELILVLPKLKVLDVSYNNLACTDLIQIIEALR